MPLTEDVYLIGFSGSGKSTIGPRLARRLKADFVDTDALIEKRAGKTIPELFAVDGESAFRTLERRTIEMITKTNSAPRVIALGGGAFQNTETRRQVRHRGVVVYLSCSARELYRRTKNQGDRPMLKRTSGTTTPATLQGRIRILLAKRRSTYDRADIRVSTTSRTLSETVDMICRKLKERMA